MPRRAPDNGGAVKFFSSRFQDDEGRGLAYRVLALAGVETGCWVYTVVHG